MYTPGGGGGGVWFCNRYLISSNFSLSAVFGIKLIKCFKQTILVIWLVMNGLNRCLGSHIVSPSGQCFML
jgi:hypothetical protein